MQRGDQMGGGGAGRGGRGGGRGGGGDGRGGRNANMEELTDEEKAAHEARMKKMEEWRARHGDSVVVPLVEGAVAAIRTKGHPGKIGAVGFCWGGRYSVLAAGALSSKKLLATIVCVRERSL